MWTEPSRQPPLFYFLRADTLEYLNRVRTASPGSLQQTAFHILHLWRAWNCQTVQFAAAQWA